MAAGARRWRRREKGSRARQRNSSLLVSARQVQALVRRLPAAKNAKPRDTVIAAEMTIGMAKKNLHTITAFTRKPRLRDAMIGRTDTVSVLAKAPSCHSTTACTRR